MWLKPIVKADVSLRGSCHGGAYIDLSMSALRVVYQLTQLSPTALRPYVSDFGDPWPHPYPLSVKCQIMVRVCTMESEFSRLHNGSGF